MSGAAFLALQKEAERFLLDNGIVWRDCEVESPPDGGGQVLTPGACLCLEMLFGATSRISGMICAPGPEAMFSATQIVHFPTVDSVHAAQELLLGEYQAYFTSAGEPLLLAWSADVQRKLRAQRGPPLPSQKLRTHLLRKIAEAAEPRDEDFLY
jgi:hypothetical protein